MSSPVLCDEGGEVGRWGKTDPSSRGISRTWKMMEELMSGDVDWQAMREKMRESQAAMRSEVMEIVAGVLSAEQVDTLKRHMAEAQERRGGMGGSRSGPRGGGGGGGDF